MKITTSKANLLDAINAISKGMSSRSTLPVLSGIYIKTQDGNAIFQTTDLEVSISYTIDVIVEEEGRTVVPGRLFSDIIKSLPDTGICISGGENQITIECANSSFALNTLNPDDFPRFPETNTEETISISGAALASMVKKVGKAVSHDEARAVLTGILFEIDNETIRLVSTDTYRLAVAEMKNNTPRKEVFQAIIPGKTLEEIARLTTNEKEIFIKVSETKLVFEFNKTIFITRKIEGKFPNWRQLLPKDQVINIKVDTDAFTKAVKRMALLTQGHTPIKLCFSNDNQNVSLSAKTQDVGLSTEEIEAEVTGDNVEIAFNHQYLLDGLSVITTKETNIEIQTAVKPGIFKASDDVDYLYLAMPVRLP